MPNHVSGNGAAMPAVISTDQSELQKIECDLRILRAGRTASLRRGTAEALRLTGLLQSAILDLETAVDDMRRRCWTTASSPDDQARAGWGMPSGAYLIH